MSSPLPPAQLAALVDAYTAAKEDEAAAAEHAKDLRDLLTVAYAEAVAPITGGPLDPDEPWSPEGARHRLRLYRVKGWRLDTTRLKAQQPEIYAAYAKRTVSIRIEVSPL